MNDPVGVEKRQLAIDLENALDDEHHVGPAGIIFIEHNRHRVLQRPGEDALAEFGDLLAVPKNDSILADEIDTADMAVEIDPDTRPVEPCRHLLDMGRFTGAVIALDHDPPVVAETGQNGQCGVMVELIRLVDRRNIFRSLRKRGDLHVDIEPEYGTDIDLGVGGGQRVGAHLRHGLFVGHGGPVSKTRRGFGAHLRKWLVRRRFAMICGSNHMRD